MPKYKATCWSCGGEGDMDGSGCTCGEDTCCCAEPEAPSCDVCGSKGFLIVSELTDDNCEDAIPINEQDTADEQGVRP